MAAETEFSIAIRLKTRSRDQVIAELALRQRAVVAHWQLIEIGLGAQAIQRRLRDGRLHRLHRGVYAVGHLVVPAKGHALAAAFAYGPGALVSHRSASWLWDLSTDSRTLVDVTGEAKRSSRKGIRYHHAQRLHPDDVAEIDNIPVTGLARTFVDLAAVVPKRTLVYALEQAEALRTFDLRAIEACIARNHGRRGVKRLRLAMREIEPEAQHAHEGLERLIAFCRRRGLEMPAMNAVVQGFTVDALWADRKLIVELDSWAHHKDHRAFEEDRRRDAILGFAGYRILRVTKRLLTEDPGGLAALLSEPPSLAATA